MTLLGGGSRPVGFLREKLSVFRVYLCILELNVRTGKRLINAVVVTEVLYAFEQNV